MTKNNSKGREGNAAQPLGKRAGTGSEQSTVKTGKAEQKTAGPDGPDAAVVGATFKR